MKKGQALVFEQVLMFSIGVTIFIIYFATFNIYQDYYLTSGMNDQLTETKSVITSHIIKAAVTDGNTTTLLVVPRRIGNQPYKIDLSNNGINVSSLSSGTSKFSTLLNLNKTFNFNGRIISGSGKLTIVKRGNDIQLV